MQQKDIKYQLEIIRYCKKQKEILKQKEQEAYKKLLTYSKKELYDFALNEKLNLEEKQCLIL